MFGMSWVLSSWCYLGLSFGTLGPSWAHLGAILVHAWGPLGRLVSFQGASWRICYLVKKTGPFQGVRCLSFFQWNSRTNSQFFPSSSLNLVRGFGAISRQLLGCYQACSETRSALDAPKWNHDLRVTKYRTPVLNMIFNLGAPKKSIGSQ